MIFRSVAHAVRPYKIISRGPHQCERLFIGAYLAKKRTYGWRYRQGRDAARASGSFARPRSVPPLGPQSESLGNARTVCPGVLRGPVHAVLDCA